MEIRRELAKANPQAFLPDLAMSLNNLGSMLSDLGRRQEACEKWLEALKVIEPFYKQYPQAFEHYWTVITDNIRKHCDSSVEAGVG